MSLIKVNEEKARQIRLNNIREERHTAYIAESDPLFFKAQRGETTMQEWLDKIEEIKNRYPEI